MELFNFIKENDVFQFSCALGPKSVKNSERWDGFSFFPAATSFDTAQITVSDWSSNNRHPSKSHPRAARFVQKI